MKAVVTQGALFVGATEARTAAEDVLSALTRVREAKRWTCKAESKAGRAANDALHAAERELERALASLGASVKTK